MGLAVYRMVLGCCAFVNPTSYSTKDLFGHVARGLVHAEKEVRDTAWHQVLLRCMAYQPDLRAALVHSVCDVLLNIEDSDAQLQEEILKKLLALLHQWTAAAGL